MSSLGFVIPKEVRDLLPRQRRQVPRYVRNDMGFVPTGFSNRFQKGNDT
jgi:hypothetical protein